MITSQYIISYRKPDPVLDEFLCRQALWRELKAERYARALSKLLNFFKVLTVIKSDVSFYL